MKPSSPLDREHVQTVLYPSAILDIHFHPHQERGTVMAVVSSTGTLSFFKLSTSAGSVSLQEISTHKPLGEGEGVLFLSCSWHPSIPSLLAITTSDYQVHILQVSDTWDVCKASTGPLVSHTLEAWTVAFSPFVEGLNSETPGALEDSSQLLILYSGGDDSKLLSSTCAYTAARTDDDLHDLIEAPYPAVAVRGHEAGVTAILPLDLRLSSSTSVIVSGSYDDHIRVFSIYEQIEGAPLHMPRLLAEQNLQGGVWRLKLIKLEKMAEDATGKKQWWTALILASCMHAGSRILEITGDGAEVCEIKVLGRFEGHKSMNYGSDFQPGTEIRERNLRCVSTSFYDRLLCLWEY